MYWTIHSHKCHASSYYAFSTVYQISIRYLFSARLPDRYYLGYKTIRDTKPSSKTVGFQIFCLDLWNCLKKLCSKILLEARALRLELEITDWKGVIWLESELSDSCLVSSEIKHVTCIYFRAFSRIINELLYMKGPINY